jgi:GNAT superfamily N-acetyltransferase
MFLFTSPLHADRSAVSAPIAGGHALLRPLRHGETEPLIAVFDAMSADSRYSRYLSGTHSLSPAMLRALSAVDGDRHVAWLASIHEVPVGIARYVRTGPCVAEVALEVVDEHQGRGLGAVLLDTVTTLAAASRIRRLQATLLGSNHASRHLLDQVGLSLRPSGGQLEADGPFHLLARPRIERPAVISAGYALRDAALAGQSGPLVA